MASALLFLLLWNNRSICDSATPECLLCYLSSHYVCSSAHRKGTQFLLLQISNCTCGTRVSLEFFSQLKMFFFCIFLWPVWLNCAQSGFERSLLSSQVRCQSCLWQLKLIMSPVIQGMWIQVQGLQILLMSEVTVTSASQILESFWKIWSQVSQRKKPFSDFTARGPGMNNYRDGYTV